MDAFTLSYQALVAGLIAAGLVAMIVDDVSGADRFTPRKSAATGAIPALRRRTRLSLLRAFLARLG